MRGFHRGTPGVSYPTPHFRPSMLCVTSVPACSVFGQLVFRDTVKVSMAVRFLCPTAEKRIEACQSFYKCL